MVIGRKANGNGSCLCCRVHQESGYERAVRLLDTSADVEGVISASSEELQVVEGIEKRLPTKSNGWLANK